MLPQSFPSPFPSRRSTTSLPGPSTSPSNEDLSTKKAKSSPKTGYYLRKGGLKLTLRRSGVDRGDLRSGFRVEIKGIDEFLKKTLVKTDQSPKQSGASMVAVGERSGERANESADTTSKISHSAIAVPTQGTLNSSPQREAQTRPHRRHVRSPPPPRSVPIAAAAFGPHHRRRRLPLLQICKDKEQAETWFIGLTALLSISHQARPLTNMKKSRGHIAVLIALLAAFRGSIN